MAIEITAIASNRYAPAGSAAINLYGTGAADGLTIGQLIIAVCVKTAAVYENQSVLKMNTMTAGSVKLTEASQWLGKIADGSADWTAASAFLVGTMGIPSSDLPDELDTYNKRMQACTALKAKIDALTQLQQEEMIDLQTLVNRRDVAFSTSTNAVSALFASAQADASNF